MKIKVKKLYTIGAFIYKLIYMPNLTSHHNLLGQTLSDSQLLKVDPSSTPQTKLVTLWHEKIHGINDVYNCELSEQNIDRLAHGVVSILVNDYGLEFDWSEISEA